METWEKRRDKTLADLRAQVLPESLLFWTQGFPDGSKEELTNDQVRRQIFDIYSLPPETDELFRQLDGQISPFLDSLISIARAMKSFTSKEAVRKYFAGELLDNTDPYNLIDEKIGMPGMGLRTLYGTLLGIPKLESLTPEQKSPILEVLGYWEEAAIDTLCDPDTYYTKTKLGNEGTISEFFGCSIVFDVLKRTKESPLAQDGRYFARLKAVIKYDELASNHIKENDPDFLRQFIAVVLAYDLQGPKGQESEAYWERLKQNPDLAEAFEIPEEE